MIDAQEVPYLSAYRWPAIALAISAILFGAALWTGVPAAAEPPPGDLPVWSRGNEWSYRVDRDVEYDLFGYIHVDHIRDNWTRTVIGVLDVGGETHYKVRETHDGRLHGTVQWGTFDLELDVDMDGSGLTYVRASDMAIINQSMDTVLSADDIPFVGSVRGGVDNYTTYDPPVAMARFPLAEGDWKVRTTANTTARYYISHPEQNTTWVNTTETWDLNVTASDGGTRTVPAGEFACYRLDEAGTVTNETATWNVSHTWYHSTEAGSAVETYDGYQLVYTDFVHEPPNRPPEGPLGPVMLGMEEDTTLDIDLGDHFTDPDGDQLAYSIRFNGSSAANASLEGSGAEWTLGPVADWSGIIQLVASARDPSFQVVGAELVVTVRPVNDPPHVASPPPDLFTKEDDPLYGVGDLSRVFEDVDGDVLTLGVNSTPGVAASINGTALDLVPDADWVGEARVDLTARDPSGETASTSFVLKVGWENDPPTIVASGGPARIHEAENGTFWVEVEDLDLDQPEYSWYLDGFEVGGADGPSFDYHPGDLTVGAVNVSVRVRDEWGGEDSLQWTVGILDSPWIRSSSPASPVETAWTEGVAFGVEVEDADTPDPLITWTWRGSVVGTGPDLVLAFEEGDEGTHALLVEVTDGIGADDLEWEVRVTVPDLAPGVTITSPGNGSRHRRGDAIALGCLVEDDGLSPVTVRWFVDGSPVGTGVELDYPAVREGSLVIGVAVSDAVGSASDEVTVVVEGPEPDTALEEVPGGPWSFLALALAIAAVAVALVVLRRRGRGGADIT